MKQKLRIDIVSDVVCPWCIVGYKRLEKALDTLKEKVDYDIHWQPFELNPDMVAEGEHLREHIQKKYGSSAEDSQRVRDHLTSLGAGLGFTFKFTEDMRIYNTFNAHQLLHWAGETSDKQMALKLAFFDSYFTDTQDVSQTEILLESVGKAGLDVDEAKAVLNENRYADAINDLQMMWRQAGISGVPAVILNQKHLVSGAQEVDTFINVIEQVLQEAT